jgi:hypothetical protein
MFMTGYEELANAIILQAVKDYRADLQILKQFPHNERALKDKEDIDDFFYSSYFAKLTRVEPEVIIHRLEAEV